ncbi:DUF4184 family protein [Gottschalkiaceae bacterium SANA]|nr:DUF4184 family protein [Gottschalkiaceae bacterium SANA]
MAFTFAHPAAVLPLQKQKNRFHFTALVLGSMAPDFEYFLFVKPFQVAGHTLAGLFTTNLPLVFIVWLIYEIFVRDPFLRYLPEPLWKGAQQYRRAPQAIRHGREAWMFVYSALLGMLTHIVWDSFTHRSGLMVEAIPVLKQGLLIAGSQIPVYKILQHASTLIGFFVIAWFLNEKLKVDLPPVRTRTERMMAGVYWGAVLIASGFFYIGLTLFFYHGSIGGLVMRILDSGLLGLVCISMVDRFWGTRRSGHRN